MSTTEKELKERIVEAQKELKLLDKLRARFPDVEKITCVGSIGDWISKKANGAVDDFRLDLSSDYYTRGMVRLCVWPFINIDGHKVHSDPEKFVIGEESPGYKGKYSEKIIYTYSDWKKRLRLHNISADLIADIESAAKGMGAQEIETPDRSKKCKPDLMPRWYLRPRMKNTACAVYLRVWWPDEHDSWYTLCGEDICHEGSDPYDRGYRFIGYDPRKTLRCRECDKLVKKYYAGKM